MKLIAGNTLANGSQNTDKDGKSIFSANNIDLDDPLGKKNIAMLNGNPGFPTKSLWYYLPYNMLTFYIVQCFSITKKPAPKKRV